MNWILIVVCGILLISIGVGLWKGAIKIIVSLLTTLVVMGAVFFATPYVTGFLTTATPLGDIIEDQTRESTMNIAQALVNGETPTGSMSEESVRMALRAAGVSDADLESMGITVQDIIDGKVTSDDLAQHGISKNVLSGANVKNNVTVNETDLSEIPRDVQISAINSADIPDVFKELLLTNNNNEIYQKLGADSFVSYVAKYMSKLIINVVAFLFCFIIITIIVRAIVLALDIISNLPVLGFVNRIAGGVLGMGGALIIIWVIFIGITLIYSSNIGKELYAMIQDQSLLALIYEYNPIMKLATTLR